MYSALRLIDLFSSMPDYLSLTPALSLSDSMSALIDLIIDLCGL